VRKHRSCLSKSEHYFRIFPTLYVKINPELLHVLWVGTGISKEVKPVVAINKKGKGLAIGQRAETAVAASGGTLRLVCGFDHPRIVIGDFDAAGEALKLLIEDVFTRKVFISPVVVVYPVGTFEGGLSQVERRALNDLALSTGAREVLITEHDLSEPELLDLKALRKKLNN